MESASVFMNYKSPDSASFDYGRVETLESFGE